MEVNPAQLAALLQNFGFPTAALALVVWAFLTERVVPGGVLRRVIAERDRALELLATKAGDNERALADLRARLEERTDRRSGRTAR